MVALLIGRDLSGRLFEVWCDSVGEAMQKVNEIFDTIAHSASDAMRMLEEFEAMMREARPVNAYAADWRAVECRHNALAEIRIRTATAATKTAGYYRRILLSKSGYIASAGKRLKGR